MTHRSATYGAVLRVVGGAWGVALIGSCGNAVEGIGIACDPRTLSAHIRVPVGREALNGVSLDVCMETCDHVDLQPSKTSQLWSYACTATFGGGAECQLFDADNGWSEIVVSDRRYVPRDGQVVHVTFNDPSGVLSFDETRTLRYDNKSCTDAALMFEPGATAALTCTGTPCDSGATLTANMSALPHGIVTLTACRNDRCVTSQDRFIGGESAALCGTDQCADLRAEYSVSGTSVAFVVKAMPQDFHDGDVYRFTITAEDGSQAFDATATAVTYAASYPNGVPCDIDACLWANLKP